jgi:signal transduction histidine kinase
VTAWRAIADSVAQYSEELGKARDTFTAILGHDLRSPLAAIVMSAHNLASTRLSPDQSEKAVATISRSAHARKNMIRDLLDFAGSRLGRSMPIRVEHGRLDAVCDLVLNEVMAIYPKRNFEFETEGDLDGEFDPGRVGQILSNLLNNAVNHGDGTQPVRMAARGDGDTLSVSVTNHGAPIPPENLQNLFRQPPATRQPPGPGSSGLGLGLYIAHEIAAAHAGSISAESGSEVTTFTLSLPRRQAVATEASV